MNKSAKKKKGSTQGQDSYCRIKVHRVTVKYPFPSTKTDCENIFLYQLKRVGTQHITGLQIWVLKTDNFRILSVNKRLNFTAEVFYME